MIENRSGFRGIGKGLKNRHQSFRADQRAGHAGLPILIDEIHLHKPFPKRRLFRKQGLAKNLLLHGPHFHGPDNSIDAMIMCIVVLQRGPSFDKRRLIGQVPPTKRCRGGEFSSRLIYFPPILPRIVFDYILDKGIIAIVIDVVAAG